MKRYPIFLKKCGFSLVELIIALSIFSIIMLGLVSTFRAGLDAYERIDSASRLNQSMQIILSRMELEIKNAFAFSQDDAQFQGTKDSLAFVSLMETFENKNRALDIQRIKYALNNSALTRERLSGLECILPDAQPMREEISSDIEEISFEYASKTKGVMPDYVWQDAWPAEQGPQQLKSLPLAVKISLTKQGQAFSKIIAKEQLYE